MFRTLETSKTSSVQRGVYPFLKCHSSWWRRLSQVPIEFPVDLDVVIGQTHGSRGHLGQAVPSGVVLADQVVHALSWL